MAHKLVFSLGFQMHTLPQTQASILFQLHTATGKLAGGIILKDIKPNDNSRCILLIQTVGSVPISEFNDYGKVESSRNDFIKMETSMSNIIDLCNHPCQKVFLAFQSIDFHKYFVLCNNPLSLFYNATFLYRHGSLHLQMRYLKS